MPPHSELPIMASYGWGPITTLLRSGLARGVYWLGARIPLKLYFPLILAGYNVHEGPNVVINGYDVQ